ncbi:hypothetical protein [Gloeobacter violaceus]|uniref:hypothetical protein n=1 Tax=Gloeobacter violaceus TaxID=33072 RepID=UPI0002FC92AD|nr:hypothetical protein [Gloeobacter violaceus]
MEEEFRYQTEDCVVVCPECQASSAGDLQPTLKRLAGCQNCKQDIDEDGELSGVGDAILSALSRRYGSAVVWQEWKAISKL